MKKSNEIKAKAIVKEIENLMSDDKIDELISYLDVNTTNLVIEALRKLYANDFKTDNWRTNAVLRNLYKKPNTIEVGMGATEYLYSDSHAFTIVSISKSGKEITLQRDNATKTNIKDLKFHVGGFSSHCSNQSIQKYTYTPNPKGATQRARLTSKGWATIGSKRANIAINVRHEYYDYNF